MFVSVRIFSRIPFPSHVHVGRITIPPTYLSAVGFLPVWQ
jgi:hypothetical protein